MASAGGEGGRFVEAQRPHRPDKLFGQNRTVEFDLKYDFSVPGETQRIEFRLVVPQTIDCRQNILSVSYSPGPSRVFEANGNRYAEFVLVNPGRHAGVVMTVKAELLKYDLLTARLNRRTVYPYAQSEPLDDFLRSEKYIEKDHPEIRQITEDIEGETEIDIVKNIYDYVLDTMEYTALSRTELGAVKAAQSGKGDCTEYSDLFVALCRAKGIPARVASGYTVGFGSTSTRHNWVEVYLGEFGWVPFDPTAGDVENVMLRGMAFSNLRPVYIYVSHIRNDPVLRNYGFGAYRYWGDRITLKDSIDFRHVGP